MVANFIPDLGFDLEEIPFAIESARSSFMRTIDGIPPSQSTQQFKDGVIWADCLSLAQTDDVTLVTGDKAFYEGGDFESGLSSALRTEIADLPHDLKIVRSLGALMEDIRRPVDVSDELLVSAVNTQLGADISGILDRLGFARVDQPIVSKRFYAAEAKSSLFVEFCLEFPCEDTSSAGRVNVVLTVAGDGQYQFKDQEFLGLSQTDLGIAYETADGLEERRRGAYVRVEGSAIGPRIRHYRVQKRLEGREA